MIDGLNLTLVQGQIAQTTVQFGHDHNLVENDKIATTALQTKIKHIMG